MRQLDTETAADVFECMAEWSMSNMMHERRSESDLRFRWFGPTRPKIVLDYPYQLTGGVKHSSLLSGAKMADPAHTTACIRARLGKAC
jgi:hypothetical protein